MGATLSSRFVFVRLLPCPTAIPDKTTVRNAVKMVGVVRHPATAFLVILLMIPSLSFAAELKAERGYTAHDQPGELFNLRVDPAQRHNRYAEQPQLVRELKALLEKYQAEGRSNPGAARKNDVPIQPYAPRPAAAKGKAAR